MGEFLYVEARSTVVPKELPMLVGGHRYQVARITEKGLFLYCKGKNSRTIKGPYDPTCFRDEVAVEEQRHLAELQRKVDEAALGVERQIAVESLLRTYRGVS